jgi:adenosylcobinamide kinase / adenosylcobinamide-phosphate guanylyltransferase
VRSLIVGPRASGKSAAAENELLRRGGPIRYVATLPYGLDTKERIERHAARRDARWKVYEMSGSAELDLAQLRRLLGCTEPVLVDGLFMLVARLSRSLGSTRGSAATPTLVDALIAMFASASTDWIIVDPPPTALDERGYSDLALELVKLHRGLLAAGASSVTFPSIKNRGLP